MKFYKRLNLDAHNPQSNRFAVEEDGRAIIDTASSLRLPKGQTLDRPALDAETGQIRQNVSLQDLEALVRTTWERIRMVRPATITVQNFGSGNYFSNIFGPLNAGYKESYDSGGAANIQVYVDNVFQIPFTNYDLVDDPSPVTSVTTATSSASTSLLFLDNVFNVQPGAKISGSASLAENTEVVETQLGTTNIVINPPLLAPLPASTSLTFTFNTGTYIQFSGSVPAKPVVAILGLDGYFPPNTD
jgi:hypothetical protein